MPVIPADHKNDNVQVEINLPESVQDTVTQVDIPVVNENRGSVAYLIDENGNEVLIPESNAKNGILSVPLTGSGKIIIKDASKTFTDLGSNYDKKNYPGSGIAYVSARNIFNGQGNGSFDLEGEVTRGTIARVLYNLEGNPSVAGLATPKGVGENWYTNAAKWAVNNKLMAQGSDFRGDEPLTREQLAMILWRYNDNPTPQGDLSSYSAADQATISTPEMKNAVSWAVGEKILGQGSPLNGQNGGTRAQVANMLYRYLAKVNVSGTSF